MASSRVSFRVIVVVFGLLAAGAAPGAGGLVADPAAQSVPFERIPAAFEPNLGQFGDGVLFAARGSGYTLALTDSEAVLAGAGQEEPPVISRLRWLGAARDPEVRGLRRLEATTAYFLGNDPARWRSRVPRFEAVEYAGIYPGIDLLVYFGAAGLEYDFVVAPGADPEAIRLELDGGKPELDPEGNLRLSFAAAEVVHRAPEIFQEVAGRQRQVPGAFRLRPGGEVGFEVADYDRGRPLVIDPKINFSTYLGGEDLDGGAEIAVDSNRRTYVVGTTYSAGIGGVPAERPLVGEPADVVVARFNRQGRLERVTYLGGVGFDSYGSIAVARGPGPQDPEVVYILGGTFAPDFPTENPIQAECQRTGAGECSGDATITVLDLDLREILFSTYLGGNDVEDLFLGDLRGALAVDAGGRIAVAAATLSADLPTEQPTQKKRLGAVDGFVSVLEPTGDGGYRLAFSAYLGGRPKKSQTYPTGLAFDPDGRLQVVGWTDARKKFPTVDAIQTKRSGKQDGFLTVYDLGDELTAPEIVFSTYFGGKQGDFFRHLAIDNAGRSYVAGDTQSPDYPTLDPFDDSLDGGVDAVVTVFDVGLAAVSSGTPEVVMSTLFGGSEYDGANSIAVDRRGIVHFAGSTFSRDLPLQSPTQDDCAEHPSARPDCWDGFVARFHRIVAGQTPRLKFSTFLGGPQVGTEVGGELGLSVAVDRTGATYVAGRTNSPRFPTQKAEQREYGGEVDLFVAKINK